MSMAVLTKGRLKIAVSYYVRAKTRYHLHSPFLSQLVTAVFCSRTAPEAQIRMKAYRNLVNHYTDCGLGDSPFATLHRQVGLSIARFAARASSPMRQCEQLYRLAGWLNPQSVLELGTGCGMGTLALSLGAASAHIASVEGNPELVAFCAPQFEAMGLKQVHFVSADFDAFLAKSAHRPWDLVYLDGNHQLEPTLRYVRALLERPVDKLCLVIDDIHHSPEMYRAWDLLTREQSIRCSLETLRLGFLFADQALTPGRFTWIPYAYKPWQIGLFS